MSLTRFGILLAGIILPILGLNAREPPTSSDVAAVVQMLKSDPTFLRALAEELKHDPDFRAKVAEQTSESEGSTSPDMRNAKTNATESSTARNQATYTQTVVASESEAFAARPISRNGGTPSYDALSGTMPAIDPRSPASGSQSRLQIDASTGTSVATIAIAFPFDPSHPDAENWVNQNTIGIKISAPIDNKDEGSASFGTTTGLASGLTVGGDFTFARTKDFEPLGVTGARDLRLISVCNALGFGPSPNDCSAQLAFDGVLRSPLGSAARAAWDSYLKESVGMSRLFNAHFNVTHTNYKYFVDPAKDAITDAKLSWNVGALGGLVSANRLHFVGVGFDFTHSYKEAKDAASCMNSTTPYLSCTLGKFAAPTDQVHRIVSIQTRNVVPLGSSLQLPVSLVLAHDLVEAKGRHEDSADMPIYFLHNKDGLFTGGVRLGWTTSNRFVGGVFVGSQFDILPGTK